MASRHPRVALAGLLARLRSQFRFWAVMYLAIVAGWYLVGVPTALANPTKTDFVAFYTGGVLAAHDSGHLYDDGAQRAVEATLLGPLPADTFYPFVNAPPSAWALAPLAAFSLPVAQGVFMALSLLALIAAAVLLARMLPADWSGWARILACALAIGFDGMQNLLLCQWGPVQVLALVAGVAAIGRGRPFAGGLLLAIVLVKPQTGLLLLPALVVGRHWRAAAGITVGAAAWIGVSVLLVGVDGTVAWLHSLSWMRPQFALGSGVPAVFAYLSSPDAAVVVGVVLAALCCAVFLVTKANLRDADVAIGAAIALSLAVAVHVHLWDSILAAFPLVILMRRNLAAGAWAAIGVGAAAVVGFHSSSPIHATGFAMALLGAAVLMGFPRSTTAIEGHGGP